LFGYANLVISSFNRANKTANAAAASAHFNGTTFLITIIAFFIGRIQHFAFSLHGTGR
jgi:uncharacterized membrane protein YdcZ (DUF606 family)